MDARKNIEILEFMDKKKYPVEDLKVKETLFIPGFLKLNSMRNTVRRANVKFSDRHFVVKRCVGLFDGKRVAGVSIIRES